MSPKLGNFEFSRVSRRDRVGFSNRLDLHMHQCGPIFKSKFQWLMRFDFKNLYPLFGSCILMGDKLGNATDIGCLLVSPTLIFGAAIRILCQMSAKIGALEFSSICR